MHTRNLHNLSTGAVGFGAMVLSPGMYGPIDDRSAVAALHAAIDAGCTLIDTSDGYGTAGHNESLVGRAIAGRRAEVQLETKFGFLLRPGADAHTFSVRYAFGRLAVNADPRYVRDYAHESLRRLGTDYLDVYYPHFPDPQVPFADTVGAVAELIHDGSVRHLGVSNVTAAQLRQAHAVHPVSVVQTQWAAWTPIDPELLDVIDEIGAGIVAWSPLGGGFLTATVTTVGDQDFRQAIDRYRPENLAANVDRYAPMRALAADLQITPGQLALAWLLHEHPRVVPIPGSRTVAHIRQNAQAADIVFDDDTVRRVRSVLAGIQPAGEMSVL